MKAVAQPVEEHYSDTSGDCSEWAKRPTGTWIFVLRVSGL